MSAGWRWSIPLTTRVGNGYVYSSAHIPDEEAEAELRAACGSTADARVLRMRVGRVAKTWHRNCLAAGLSQGFIEPLEATALHIVIATALEFVRAFEDGGFTDRHRDAFHDRVALRYEGVRDYIVAHYRMNQRNDSPYWRANRENQNLSDGLKAMMTAWFTHGDLAEANARAYTEPAYSAMSWHALFAGYGSFPAPPKMQPAGPAGRRSLDKVEAMLSACAVNFAEI